MAIVAYIVLVIIAYTFWNWIYQHKRTRKNNFLRKIPQPSSSLPFLGVALDFTSTKVFLDVVLKYTEKYGAIVTAKIGPIRQLLLVSDYRLLEHVLSSTKLLTKSDDYHFLRPWLGTGLLTSDGQKWKTHRKILTPAFHFQILEQFIDIFESCGNRLISKFEENLQQGNLDIYPYVTLCSLDVICESIMGISINAQNDKDSEYVRSVKEMCKIILERSISPVEMYDWLYPLSKNYYAQKKALKILHKQSNDVIQARRRELEKMQQSNNANDEKPMYFKNKKAFLDLLLQTKVEDRLLTNDEIRQEVDTFMFEGHDTTASALSFTLYCLATYPDVQEKVFEELQYIFQDREDEAASYTDLQNMKYLESVIKESLRLYPSVPIFGRKVVEDMQYDDDFIPKGTTMLIFAFGIHRDPKYFENPAEFRPERFRNVDGKLPYAYIPFSAGPRNCIGQKFAMFEMKCIISKILRKFQLLSASPEHKLQLVCETILKSENGIKIQLQPRRV